MIKSEVEIYHGKGSLINLGSDFYHDEGKMIKLGEIWGAARGVGVKHDLLSCLQQSGNRSAFE